METFIDKTFERTVPSLLAKGEYERCTFNQCDLTGMNASHYKFMECTFLGCNLSLMNLSKTSFQDTLFKDCKMLGIRFDQCHDFALSFNFESCILHDASFFRLKLKKITFRNCQLHHTDFAACDLTTALFDACDLRDAIFENTILEKADFTTSFNYIIDPEINRIKKATFSQNGLRGLLMKYDINVD